MRRALSVAKLGTFRHGVRPDERKEATEHLPIERMPFVKTYVLPLSQHTGKPSKPIVAVGDRVERGELIAEADGFISTALHAPVTGTVVAIEPRPHPNGRKMPAIVIEIDPFSSQQITQRLAHGEQVLLDLVQGVQQAGIVGLGGAAFPSHVKLQVPEGKIVRFVIINGCECEPYLTCDHRLMVERADDVVKGLRLIMKQVGAERGYIGVEINKKDAIEALEREVGDDAAIEIVALAVKYPQGAEKTLIDAIFKREVPAGGLPLELDIVVQNVGTAASLADLVDEGIPLIERIVTVSGPGMRRPTNLIVPVGTLLEDVVEHCGGLLPETRQVIFGGPMMGQAQKRLDVPVLKGTSGILALTSPAALVREEPCIRCGRCLEACPMFLNPSRLAQLVKLERAQELADLHQMDCFECASCSFVCPSNIPLVQMMRVGKAMVRSMKQP
ncbi:MAG: electron transport complex subunit RsxC, partial [Acidobacteriota bacterium]